MTVSNGEIWLANLNPVKRANEVGKVRPVYIFQADKLNRTPYPTTIILPLTTVCIDDAEPLRMRIAKRENLRQDSDILIAQVRAIDKSRLLEKLATLSAEEIEKIKQLFDEVVG